MIELKERHERVEIPVERLLQIEDLMERFLGDVTAIRLMYLRWTAGCREFTNLVDTRASDPMLYRLPNHSGRLSNDWPSRVLKDFPAHYHGRMCAIEYEQCKRSMNPIAHYIRHRYGVMEREYFRLVVPLSDGTLAYATRRLWDPAALAPHARD
jgi:hypothetical protein